MDSAGRILRVDTAGCQLLRLDFSAADQLVGEPLASVLSGLGGTPAERYLHESLGGGERRAFPLYHPPARQWLYVLTRPAPNGVVLILRATGAVPADTTEAEPAASRADGAAGIDEALPPAEPEDFVFTYDAQGRLVFANPALLRHWGLPLPAVLGQSASALYPEVSRGARLETLVDRTLRTGQPVRDELLITRPDRTPDLEVTSLHPIFDSDGRINGVAGSSQTRQVPPVSMSSRQRAEVLCTIAEELFIAENRRTSLAQVFKRVARAVGAEVWIHRAADSSGTLQLEASHGLTSDQLQRLADPALLAPSPAALTRGLPVVVDQHGPEPAATRTFEALGIRAFVCCPLQADGRLLGTITFAAGMRAWFTEDEIRFAQSATDLIAASIDRTRLLAELRQSRDLAEQASQAKDNFLAALSHELRTPLNPVLLLATNGAGNASLPPAVRADFELIARNVSLETRLIDDLLDLTRITHGKLSLVKELLDVHHVLREALGTVKAEIEEKAIELSLELTADPVRVRGDAVRLQQAFWNLLKNAVKFSPQGGRISVRSLLTANRAVRVEIADTGIGLTAAEIASVFESFAQGHHAANGDSPFGGLGLGLSITRTMVSLHSGRIDVTSAGRNQGACFAVELPLAGAEAGAAGDGLATPVPRRPASRPGIRILLIEDHQPTRQALLQLLVHRDYEVIGAAGVAEALSIVTRKHFDLVISDIGLPDGNGYDLMTTLRRDFGLRGVALTGYGSEQDLAMARAAGFIAHLTKPVSIQALEAALAAAFPAP